MKLCTYIILLVFITSCSGTKEFTDQDNQAYEALKTLVAAKNLHIDSNKASALGSVAFSQVANTGILGPGNSATWIDITTNSNYLNIKGDTISAFLPFFGEQHFGGGYPGSNHEGIEFNSSPEEYQVTENDAKHSINIQFKIDDQYRTSEHYKVYITLFPNHRSDIQFSSSNRSSMGFTGDVEALKEESKKQ